MTDAEIIVMLESQLDAARAIAPSEDDFRKAMNYYYCRPRGDERAGRSVIQSSDVRDMVHAVMAQIMPTFTQDSLCQFEPDGPDDEAQARLESDATNAVLMERSRGYTVFSEAVKDALIFKNGVVKSYLEEMGERRYIRTRAVAPENFLVGQDTDCVLLYQARFVAERHSYSRAELVAMGFDREAVSTIPNEAGGGQDTLQLMRQRGGTTSDPANAGWANENVTVWECYSQLPDSKDATSTSLYRCLLGGKTLLLQEPSDGHPYAAGSAVTEPHKFWGLSLYDLLFSVQDAKTAIQRQWLDNLANCNNSRTAVNDQVNLDDVLTGRPGGVVRVKGIGPVAESLTPLPSIDVGPAAGAFLSYMDQVRSDRGGAALQMQSAELQSINSAPGFQAVDRIYSVQEALSGWIARNLAETLLRSAFMQVHRLLRFELAEPLTLRMADQWLTVDPATWRQRERVNIRSGLSPGERSRKVAALQNVITLQTQAIGGGMDGVLVNMGNLYNSFIDWCAANDLDAGEKYFLDPKSQQSQQAAQAKMTQGQQQGQMQQQLQMIMLQIEKAKLEIEQQKLQLQKVKDDSDTQFKYYEARLSAEVEEAKLIGTATADLQRIELEGRLQSLNGAGGGAGAAENGAGTG